MNSLLRIPRRPNRPTRLLQAMLVAGLLVVPVGGCDWNIEKKEVKEGVEKAIQDWYIRALNLCNELKDPVLHDQCILKLAADNTELSKKLIEILATQINCDETKWKSVADVIEAVLKELAKAIPSAIGLIAGLNGQVNMNAFAQANGNQLVFQPGSQLGVAYAGGQMIFHDVQGSLSLELHPDGQGGFAGTVTNFNANLSFFGEPTALALDTEALTPEVAIDPEGHGLIKIHFAVTNDILGDPVWYAELPIQALPPFDSVLFSTGGPVPGEKIFPRFQPAPDDCNGNGVDDTKDILSGTSLDCNGDGVPDDCQIGGADCNGNGVPDSCDIAEGLLHDADANGFADECEPPPPCIPDLNKDGVLDLFDFLTFVNLFNDAQHEADCDMNGVLDLFDFLCFVNAFNAGC